MQRKPGKLDRPRYPAHYRTFSHQISHLLKARDADRVGVVWAAFVAQRRS